MTVTIIETHAVRDGNPNFSVSRQVKQIGDVWDYADDSKILAIESDRLADDLRIGVETTTPQSLAHDRREDFVWMIFFRQKYAAHHRLDAEQGEKSGRNNSALNLLRLSRARQIECPIRVSGDLLKDLILIAPVRKIRI